MCLRLSTADKVSTSIEVVFGRMLGFCLGVVLGFVWGLCGLCGQSAANQSRLFRFVLVSGTLPDTHKRTPDTPKTNRKQNSNKPTHINEPQTHPKQTPNKTQTNLKSRDLFAALCLTDISPCVFHARHLPLIHRTDP